jgi:arylsulfatase A-like enzyme
VRAEPDGRLWKLIEPTTARGRRGFPAWEGRKVDPHSQARYERGVVELFDLSADPAETKDLAADHPDVVRELQAGLDAWWRPGLANKPSAGPDTKAAVPAAASATATGVRTAPRPNLLVFLADDLGAGDLGCTGSTYYRTPAIDGLAKAGMRFTRGYATCPVCSPTRAALVTGRHPARVGITNYIGGARRGRLLPADYLRALPEAEITVPELLQQAGYATGCFGKWHLGLPADVRRHGFDTVGSNAVAPGSGPPHDPMHARAIAAQATSFIESQAGRPWFCYVPMHSVHVPLAARPELVAEETGRAAALPPAAGPREVPEGDRMARAVQDLPVYAAMIREMDETVATVLATLERTGQAKDTLVVFTSDNGGLSTAEGAPTSNLPLRAGKGYLYEGGIRVPLLVRWPGVVAPGSTCAVPVTTLDIAATLLDVGGCGLPAEHVLDGASLRPLLAGAGLLAARDLRWHYPHYPNQGGRPGGALIAGDGPAPGTEKIVEHFEDGRVELFDLAADPGEQRDLAAERPARARALQARLAAWRKDVAAKMPTPNPQPVEPYGPEGLPPRK